MTTVHGKDAAGPLYIPGGEGAVVKMTKIQFISLPQKEQDKIKSAPGNRRVLSRWGLWNAARSKIPQKMQPLAVETVSAPAKPLVNRGFKQNPQEHVNNQASEVSLPPTAPPRSAKDDKQVVRVLLKKHDKSLKLCQKAFSSMNQVNLAYEYTDQMQNATLDKINNLNLKLLKLSTKKFRLSLPGTNKKKAEKLGRLLKAEEQKLKDLQSIQEEIGALLVKSHDEASTKLKEFESIQNSASEKINSSPVVEKKIIDKIEKGKELIFSYNEDLKQIGATAQKVKVLQVPWQGKKNVEYANSPAVEAALSQKFQHYSSFMKHWKELSLLHSSFVELLTEKDSLQDEITRLELEIERQKASPLLIRKINQLVSNLAKELANKRLKYNVLDKKANNDRLALQDQFRATQATFVNLADEIGLIVLPGSRHNG